MKIFFDLDGTLLDSKPRLYRLFQALVPKSTLSFEAYWDLKMNKTSHKELLNMLGYSVEQYNEFEKIWMEKIESKEWLALDKPFLGVINFLKMLKLTHQLYIVTARQRKDLVINQLETLGFTDLFENILVTSQKGEKYDLINGVIKTSEKDWFVGDTGIDIQTGKLLKMNTAAVLSGFLNEEKLKQYMPDLIVSNVTCLNFNFKNG